MKTGRVVGALMVAGGLAVGGCEQSGRVVDFDSCVLAHVSGAQTKMAAGMAYEACESKFKGREQVVGEPLDVEQMESISMERRGSKFSDFSFRVYNGLSDVTLTEVTVELMRMSDERTWRYNMQMEIPPLTTDTESFDVMDDVLRSGFLGTKESSSFKPHYTHRVVAARGYARE